jgi:hypothetical protein
MPYLITNPDDSVQDPGLVNGITTSSKYQFAGLTHMLPGKINILIVMTNKNKPRLFRKRGFDHFLMATPGKGWLVK